MHKILYSVYTLIRHEYLKMDLYTGLGRMIATKALKMELSREKVS
jgi:hypothetical protein